MRTSKRAIFIATAVLSISTAIFAASTKESGMHSADMKQTGQTKVSDRKTVDSDQSDGYRIDQPGTITFTVGVKIKGKVEKPQVVIFLPKEKPLYRKLQFDRSFKEDLMDPLPFTPVVE